MRVIYCDFLKFCRSRLPDYHYPSHVLVTISFHSIGDPSLGMRMRRRSVLEGCFQASAAAVAECKLQMVQRQIVRPVVVFIRQMA